MIQRVQTIFLFFSSICLILIVYYFPVLQDTTTDYFLTDYFPVVRGLILFSASLSIFAIFQFKNRKRQQLIALTARFMITISLILLVFYRGEDQSFGLGMILLIVPFLALIAANFFIKKDEKLVRSADRIR